MQLIDLIGIQASSTDQSRMEKFILEELSKLDVHVHVETLPHKGGTMNNYFITKGEAESYPTFAAHMDTVHMIHESYSPVTWGDIIFCVSRKGNTVQQVGTGGDDKCGVYGCYELLRRLPACKVMLFSFEESGF